MYFDQHLDAQSIDNNKRQTEKYQIADCHLSKCRI